MFQHLCRCHGNNKVVAAEVGFSCLKIIGGEKMEKRLSAGARFQCFERWQLKKLDTREERQLTAIGRGRFHVLGMVQSFHSLLLLLVEAPEEAAAHVPPAVGWESITRTILISRK